MYIHYEYIKQRKREEEKRSAARRGALTVVAFVFEETARENREREQRENRERDFVRLEPQRIKTRKDCKSSERYEENARALKHALY